MGKQWIQKLTSKLFEAQSAMSRHRFKLMKRMSNPLFERPGGNSLNLKKRLLECVRFIDFDSMIGESELYYTLPNRK